MAYNSEQIELQPPGSPRRFLGKLLTKGKLFAFTKANSTISTSLASKTKPSEMKKYDESKIFWDEHSLKNESFSGFSQLYFFIAAFAKMVLMFFLPIFYGFFIIALIFGSGTWKDGEEFFYGLTYYVTIPCFIIYIHFKLVSKGCLFLAPFIKGKRVYDLNRHTGSVTLFQKGNKARFSHPFIEFDCVLMSAPSPQGHLNYNLMLVHRYNDYSVGVPISNLIGTNETVAKYHRLWNMIQCYMDVSQPLPDILILEPARQKDPVTADYDRKTGRNPRYWRDMSDEEYQRKMAEIAAKQQSQPTTGPKLNIFK